MKVRNGSGVSIMQSPSHRAGYNAGTVYGHREVNAAAQLDAGSPQRSFAPEVEERVERAYMPPAALPLLCLFVGLVL